VSATKVIGRRGNFMVKELRLCQTEQSLTVTGSKVVQLARACASIQTEQSTLAVGSMANHTELE
jgi:hypothetical protein